MWAGWQPMAKCLNVPRHISIGPAAVKLHTGLRTGSSPSMRQQEKVFDRTSLWPVSARQDASSIIYSWNIFWYFRSKTTKCVDNSWGALCTDRVQLLNMHTAQKNHTDFSPSSRLKQKQKHCFWVLSIRFPVALGVIACTYFWLPQL